MSKLLVFTSNVIKQEESKKKLLNFISRVILIMIFCSILSNSYGQNRSEKKYVSDSILVQVIQSNGYKSIDSIVYKQDTLLYYYLTAKNKYDSMRVLRILSEGMYYTVERENFLVYFHKIMLSQDSIYVHGYSEIIDTKKPILDQIIDNERGLEYNQHDHDHHELTCHYDR